MSKALFFIGIIPHTEILDEVQEFKHYCKTRFDSSKALNSPAHITLIPPFKFEFKDVNNLVKHLNEDLNKYKEFYLSTDGFDHFGDRVLFVKLEKNRELDELQFKLKNRFNAHPDIVPNKNQNFHPHMTIAFRDLTKENFYEAWDHFHKIHYKRVFYVKGYFLLKHDGQKWKILNQFNFA